MVETLTYDPLQRLKSYSVKDNGLSVVNTTYDYFSDGSFKFKSDYAHSYLYGNEAKSTRNAGPSAVKQVTKYSGGTVYFTYDNKGNMTSGDGLTAKYTAFNKPYELTRNGNTYDFVYGADDMRYKQTRKENGKTETILYFDKSFELQTNGEWRHYLSDIAVISYDKTNKHKINFMHNDRLGSAITFTDHNGQLVNRRSFDAFGKPRGGYDGSTLSPARLAQNDTQATSNFIKNNKQGFTTHEHLDGAEIIHMNGRVYDYNLGRFMSVDPLIQSPTNSQSLNPYSYIMNNPLSGTDPSGYCAVHLQSQLVCSQSPFQDSIMPDGGPFIVKDNFSLSSSDNEKTNASESSSKNQDIGESVSGSVDGANKEGSTSGVAGTTIALPAASGVGELSLATIGRALLGTLSALTLSGDTPLEDKEMLTVFRGTTFTDEHMVHAETGILMSEAARQAYNEEMYASGDKMKAIVAASEANLIRHSELLRKYGGETGLAITQSDGSFTSREYPRSMFSVTTNENIAKQFAKGPGGKVYMARIPKGALVKQPLKSSNESEYFVRGMWNFEEYK